MYAVELVEGKDNPPHKKPEYDDKGGKTVGLLLRMTKSIWYKGFAVVLDSGFCVLKGIVELRKVGVFGAALIKKRRYWPKHIDGDAIQRHFADKDVGDADVWRGKLDGIPFRIYCMKEPDYIMSLMSSYGTLDEIEDGMTQRDYVGTNGQKQRKTFKYTEIIYNHYHYRHYVDDHNNKRHNPISLEVTWATQWWPNRVMGFFLAVTEVNVKLASEYFCGFEVVPMLIFRRAMASALIFNTVLARANNQSLSRAIRRRAIDHRLLTVDQHKRWSGTKWVAAKTQFGQRKCVQCPRKVRTYCACAPQRALCNECYTDHIVELEMEPDCDD